MVKPEYTVPVDRAIINTGSTIGQMRKTPTILLSIFTEITRNMFSTDFTEGRMPAWDRDPKKTEVWIDQEHVWEDQQPQFRPAIYVSISEIRYSSPTGKTSGLAGMELKEAEYNYDINVETGVAWNVLGNTKTESLLVAEYVEEVMMAFSRPIMHEFCFDKLQVVSFNTGTVIRESREVFKSVVTAGLTFGESWTLKLESPKLKIITINAGQQVLDVLG